MAKTNFANGTIVEPGFLDSIYNTGGGHKHDGVDSDGHAQKISLDNAVEVAGQLPLLNVSPLPRAISGLGLAYSISGNAWRVAVGNGFADLGSNIDGGSPRMAKASGTTIVPIINSAGTGYESNVIDDENPIADGAELVAYMGLTSALNTTFVFAISTVSPEDVCYASDCEYLRRIGSVFVKSLGGGLFGLRKFKQYGDEFLFQEPPYTSGQTVVRWPYTLELSLGVPTGVTVRANVRMTGICVTQAWQQEIWDGLYGSTKPTNPRIILQGLADVSDSYSGYITTDTARHFYIQETGASIDTSLSFGTYGWIDPRGRW